MYRDHCFLKILDTLLPLFAPNVLPLGEPKPIELFLGDKPYPSFETFVGDLGD